MIRLHLDNFSGDVLYISDTVEDSFMSERNFKKFSMNMRCSGNANHMSNHCWGKKALFVD